MYCNSAQNIIYVSSSNYYSESQRSKYDGLCKFSEYWRESPTPRGRYHSGRVAQNRRLGAGALTGATLKDLQLKMETKIAERGGTNSS